MARLSEIQDELFAHDCAITAEMEQWAEYDVVAYLESGNTVTPAMQPPARPAPPEDPPTPPPAPATAPPPAPTPAPPPHTMPHDAPTRFAITREHAERLVALERDSGGKYALGRRLRNGDYIVDDVILTEEDESGLQPGDRVIELGVEATEVSPEQMLSTTCHHLRDILPMLETVPSYTVVVERDPAPLPALLSLSDLLERCGLPHLIPPLSAGGHTLAELHRQIESCSRAELLAHVKGIGVERLAERQKIVSGLTKALRDRQLTPSIEDGHGRSRKPRVVGRDHARPFPSVPIAFRIAPLRIPSQCPAPHLSPLHPHPISGAAPRNQRLPQGPHLSTARAAPLA
jgi:hypothetical protein